MSNSSNQASADQHLSAVANSSEESSSDSEHLTKANSSNKYSPIRESPTMANSPNQSSSIREPPAMVNTPNQPSPNRESLAMANSPNLASPKRDPRAMAKSSNLALPKRARIANADEVESVTEDRLSSLPDEALIRILEHLPLLTAMKVTRLSRRWFRLWVCMTKLSFDQRSHPAFEDFSVFASFVDTTLLLCKSDVVRSFSLYMASDSDYHLKLPIWLGFVGSHQVTELELECYTASKYRESKFKLPAGLWYSFTLEKLKLSFTKLEIPLGFHWECLRCLTLESIRFSNYQTMDKLLAGCPALEELEMESCVYCGLYDFEPVASLKKFKIISDEGFMDMDIVCGNLKSLVIHDNRAYIIYKLHNSSSLREVELQFDHAFDIGEKFDADDINNVNETLRFLSHVEKLTLRGCCLEVFPLFKDKSLPSPLLRLRNLVLSAHFSEVDMLGLAAMLRSCPNLEILTIELQDFIWGGIMCGGEYREKVDLKLEPMETYWISQDINEFKCLRMNLKTVRIRRFGLYDCEEDNLLQFLEFILKQALMLEELIIVCEKVEERKTAEMQVPDLAQTLLSFEKSSPYVKIVFS